MAQGSDKIKIPYQALSLEEALCVLQLPNMEGYFDADEGVLVLEDLG